MAAAVVRGCLACWRHAARLTRIYTRRNGQPITTVQLYRERHAQHLAAEREGRPWRSGGVVTSAR